jgi:hypothetical protein
VAFSFEGGWSFLLVNIPLVAEAAVAALLVTNRLRRAGRDPGEAAHRGRKG